jgi:hypothetical protein
MAIGEKTKDLWKNPEYKKIMSDSHRKYIIPNKNIVKFLYNEGFSLRILAPILKILEIKFQRLIKTEIIILLQKNTREK